MREGVQKRSRSATIQRKATVSSDVAGPPTRAPPVSRLLLRRAATYVRRAMRQAIVFASTCPNCKRDQPQDGFTAADLLRLLDGGYPIEGYCVICDKFWPLSLRERVRLGELVAACQDDGVRPEDDEHPRLPRSD